MKSITTLAGLLVAQAAAYPDVAKFLQARQEPGSDAAVAASQARTNCGPLPCAIFSATEQKVSTTGEHAYASPAADQIRGPCPGLNAAANHGYIDRSGVTNILESIAGMGAVYGMSADLTGILAAVSVIFDGDPISGTYSIGGPVTENGLLGLGLLGNSHGLSYSHLTFEGDSSITRRDAYINNGDAHSVDPERFASAYAMGMEDDRYTLDMLARNFLSKAKESEATNPYYFEPYFPALVVPAAYNFVINMFSNFSAEEPSGYLDGETFKTWFAIEGDYPDFKWKPGQERIPDNYYRRPTTQAYNTVNVLEDLAVNFLAYPDSLRIGGNVNGVNTFEGVKLGDLSGGAVDNIQDLLDPKSSNAACLLTELLLSETPGLLNGVLSDLSPVFDLIDKYVTPVTGSLACPGVMKYDQTLFNKFPGYNYTPEGGATNF